jgi:hypothetical protein
LASIFPFALVILALVGSWFAISLFVTLGLLDLVCHFFGVLFYRMEELTGFDLVVGLTESLQLDFTQTLITFITSNLPALI